MVSVKYQQCIRQQAGKWEFTQPSMAQAQLQTCKHGSNRVGQVWNGLPHFSHILQNTLHILLVKSWCMGITQKCASPGAATYQCPLSGSLCCHGHIELVSPDGTHQRPYAGPTNIVYRDATLMHGLHHPNVRQTPAKNNSRSDERVWQNACTNLAPFNDLHHHWCKAVSIYSSHICLCTSIICIIIYNFLLAK